MARMMRDFKMTEKGKSDWREGNGRKPETLENSKIAAAINEWMADHPDSTNKSACARDLNLSRTTVTKWWQQIENVANGRDIEYGLPEEEIGGFMARESDPYEEELQRLQQEILDSITKDINMGAGVFEGEDMKVPDLE